MWLEDATQYLGWPKSTDITHPAGGGPSHDARLVEQKIGKSLERKFGLQDLITGILSPNAQADTAEAPFAIIIQFNQHVGDDVLREAIRLSWNFSRASLLVTFEPTRVQAWTCAMAPTLSRKMSALRIIPAIGESGQPGGGSLLQNQAAQTLHWVNLVSGQILRDNPSKFKKEERADRLLVANLRAVRRRLLALKLPQSICHSLLARLIFVQFLFQRTDSDGRPALSQSLLDGRLESSLSHVYPQPDALRLILRDKSETYALFQWLNQKFNGDLFPGKNETQTGQPAEWQVEKDSVSDDHLRLLSEFVAGRVEIGSGQKSLWPLYSFDTLPLEFISSVYEEFLNDDQEELSAYYTPSHLVDFILDGVLSWGGSDWNLRILDPCCGSGIFLVKAFQRLVQRWKNAHPGCEPRVDDLRGFLENNLFGVDRSGEAIRVTSFSLCLALCDAIDPRHYWNRAVFPLLRNARLIECDFFCENVPEIQTPENDDARKWDLVIGNAPWRHSALTDESAGTQWASNNSWPIVDGNIGPVFLGKAIAITKRSGRVSMIQPAATLLYQRSFENSDQLRKRIFVDSRVEEVISFAHLRWQLFNGVKSPACLITAKPAEVEDDYSFSYVCPRPSFTAEDDSVIAIERQDFHELSAGEAVHQPIIWTILLLGSRRDVELVERLKQAQSLRKIKAQKIENASDKQVVLTREGIIRGSSDQRAEAQIVNRRILESPDFPRDDSTFLFADELPVNVDPSVDRRASSDFSAFELPQLLIKKSLIKKVGRFQARMVKAGRDDRGIICTHSYLSVHQFRGGDAWLRSACLAYQSSVSTYYLALTSRLAFDRGEALSGDMLDVPLPAPEMLPDDFNVRPSEIDDVIAEAFQLKAPERALISDMLEFSYREGSKDSRNSRSRGKTSQSKDPAKDDLCCYAGFLLSTLRATFGGERAVRATVFEEAEGQARLPVRMVAIHLDLPDRKRLVTKETLSSLELRGVLSRSFEIQMLLTSRDGNPIASGIGFRRVARIFVSHQFPNGDIVPTVLFVKPDQRRYWSRSLGLRDADDLAATIFASHRKRTFSK